MNTSKFAFQGWLGRVNGELSRLMARPNRTPMSVEVTPRPKPLSEAKAVCPHCGQSIVEMTPWDGAT